MAKAEIIRDGVLHRLSEAGLKSALCLDRSQFLDLPGKVLAEIVLVDASVEECVSEMVREVVASTEPSEPEVDFIVHSLWKIDHLEDPQPARSESGGIVAATVVPIWLKSGSRSVVVQVAISYLAALQLRDITGRDPDLRFLARVYVESLLRLGGRSAWNPLDARNRRLEVDVGRALELHRYLAKTA